MTQASGPRVGLFVTCLVDAIRPGIGFATLRLLEEAGCQVEVPEQQTCCGQPAFNSGDDADAAALAQRLIAVFEAYDYVVLPSGSCAGSIRHGYPELLAHDPAWAARAERLAAKTYEIMSFLVDVLGFVPEGRRLEATATYHDSCAGLRELGISAQPRRLLASVEGLELRPLEGNDVCCGFGGTFCVKYPEISGRLADDKLARLAETGADTLLGGDLGCLLHLAGRLKRCGSKVKVFHTAEVLAGLADGDGIGGAAGGASQ